MIATSAHALNFFQKLQYKEVNVRGEKVLVNKFSDKVEKRFKDGKYETIPSEEGFGGIPSTQNMYQTRYEKKNSR
jgi:hypothetical protein